MLVKQRQMKNEDATRDGHPEILNTAVILFLKQNSEYSGICFILFFYFSYIYMFVHVDICINVSKNKVFH